MLIQQSPKVTLYVLRVKVTTNSTITYTLIVLVYIVIMILTKLTTTV